MMFIYVDVIILDFDRDSVASFIYFVVLSHFFCDTKQLVISQHVPDNIKSALPLFI